MTRFFAALSFAALLGCGSGTPSPADGSTAGRDLAGGGGVGCQTAADCRLYSSYCVTAPCQCLALGLHDVDPPCVGGQQSCLVDPCNGKSPACTNGACSITQ